MCFENFDIGSTNIKVTSIYFMAKYSTIKNDIRLENQLFFSSISGITAPNNTPKIYGTARSIGLPITNGSTATDVS
jgi:hypothetical protein